MNINKLFWRHHTPNNSLVKLTLLVLGLLIAGCTVEQASQPSAPLGGFKIQDMTLKAEITVDMSKKLSGEASESILLWFIPLSRPTNYADGVLYSIDGTFITSLSTLFGSGAARLKAAAAYNAVYGKADIIVAPQWVYTITDYIVFSTATARVSGYAGTLRNIKEAPLPNTPKTLNINGNMKLETSSSGVTPIDIDQLGVTPVDIDQLPNPTSTRMTQTNITAEPISTELDIGISKNGESGPKASVGDVVAYQYVCSLEDGTVVFDSRTRGQPRRRIAGGTEVPVGFSENLVGVRKGTHGDILIPSEKAFGKTGMPNLQIPPNAKIRIEYFVEDVIPS